mmetsp:Transcript_17542/g.21238  ORF Transcript_17542/g.21238 Transcript_17542/m.21238 type:complete len:242 (+) Transcript_17542:382-1107(+)
MFPVTIVLLLWTSISYGAIRWYDIDPSVVSCSYAKVVIEGEYWRLVFGWLSHVDSLHFAVNVICMWSNRNLETYYGSIEFLTRTLGLYIASNLVHFVIVHRLSSANSELISNSFKKAEWLGFSAINIGWSVIQVDHPQWKVDPIVYLLDFIPLPAYAAPCILFTMIQVVVWNSSLLNLVSGILAGYLMNIGLFEWFTLYYVMCTIQWMVVGCFLSKGFPPQFDTVQVGDQRRALEAFRSLV